MKNNYKILKYTAGDIMSDLVYNNHLILIVLDHFNINMGLKNMSIEEVCSKYNVDTTTFLAIANLLISRERKNIDIKNVSLRSLIDYLKKSHSFYIEHRLPAIREKLNEAIPHNNPQSLAIIEYYDEYIMAVKDHMKQEEKHLFGYAEHLLAGGDAKQIETYTFDGLHDDRDMKLRELKQIIIKYSPSESTNQLNRVIFDIFACEDLLSMHCDIEDYLLIPKISELEQNKTI